LDLFQYDDLAVISCWWKTLVNDVQEKRGNSYVEE